MSRGRDIQFSEPVGEWDQFRERLGSGSVQPSGHGAQDAASLVVAPGISHVRQCGRSLSAFQQKPIIGASKDASGPVTIPPFQQHAAETFLLDGGQFEHRGFAAIPHRKQARVAGDDRAAVSRQIPSAEIRREHDRCIHDPGSAGVRRLGSGP